MNDARTTPETSETPPSETPQTELPRWYVTTAIPYVNAQPHIGFALEIVLADALARYHRLRGEDVRFLTGTDDNSLKNVRAAEREGVPTRTLVERNAARFEALRGPLDLSFDDFIRTSSDPRHSAAVRALWEACAQRGDIYKRAYRGLYCVGCEQFYTEDELLNGLCPEHLTPPEVVEEENYFFRLSAYAERLRELIASDTLRIVPRTRKNEVLGLIRQGLEDFSISRSWARAHGWGIPVPGDPSQVMYVWFDALGNYISALGYGGEDDTLYQRYWVENPHRVHVIGKGILRFHAVYWPAMLLSAGVPLPTTIVVHGYVTAAGQKISKTLGNVIDPVALAEHYGADALRFYLLREIPPAADGDFSLARFVRAANTELADKLGNLLNRTVSMVSRYYDGVAPTPPTSQPTSRPTPGTLDALDAPLVALARELPARVDDAMARYEPNVALDAIWTLVDAANKYVEATEPWALAKRRKTDPQSDADERLATVLSNLLETLRVIAHLLAPFLPATANGIARQLGVSLDGGAWAEVTRWGGSAAAGTRVAPDGVLFTKHDVPAEE